jgi:hypothetical protein
MSESLLKTGTLTTHQSRWRLSSIAALIATCSTLMQVSGAHAVNALPTTITAFSSAEENSIIPTPWRIQSLPKVKRENSFDLVKDGDMHVLRVQSDASASGLLHLLDVDLGHTPLLAWRWKVSNVVTGSDFTRKTGDDYAAKVYVLFDYPADQLPFTDRVKIALARTLYGTELPTAAIAYVWGNAQPIGASGPNPFTDRVRMIVVESGAEHVGEWLMQRRNVAEDFHALFGAPAPHVTGIAISADTDNTGEAVTAWFGDLQFLEHFEKRREVP